LRGVVEVISWAEPSVSGNTSEEGDDVELQELKVEVNVGVKASMMLNRSH
jgi:hypothetical protein